jgi:hypothetical protein
VSQLSDSLTHKNAEKYCIALDKFSHTDMNARYSGTCADGNDFSLFAQLKVCSAQHNTALTNMISDF